MLDVDNFMQLMQVHQVATPRDLVGVCAQEIQKLQQRLGVVFPASYSQFLQTCGRSAGLLSPWVAFYFDDLIEIREEFDERLAALADPFEVPANALVFAQADDVFDYLFCDDSEDPPVYRLNFLADSPSCECCALTFSAYLEALVVASDREQWLDDLVEDETYSVASCVSEEDKLI
ncbi:MAG: SMI1/KNR4 family protein [Moraxellaceae bacterium]|nr:MAG: SMI1/KNR4 family protein [Moraxellaceae bacterium]